MNTSTSEAKGRNIRLQLSAQASTMAETMSLLLTWRFVVI